MVLICKIEKIVPNRVIVWNVSIWMFNTVPSSVKTSCNFYVNLKIIINCCYWVSLENNRIWFKEVQNGTWEMALWKDKSPFSRLLIGRAGEGTEMCVCPQLKNSIRSFPCIGHQSPISLLRPVLLPRDLRADEEETKKVGKGFFLKEFHHFFCF